MATLLGGLLLLALAAGASASVRASDSRSSGALQASSAAVPLRIACVGDSITAGLNAGHGTASYPAQLQTLLGAHYVVENFGVPEKSVTTCRVPSGATRHEAYSNTSAYTRALAYNADVVVIMLGTNDAGCPWEIAEAGFAPNYEAIIDAFSAAGDEPTILLATPPPLYQGDYPARLAGAPPGFPAFNQSWINRELPLRTAQVASSRDALPPPIDVFGRFQQQCPVVAGTLGHAPSPDLVVCPLMDNGVTNGPLDSGLHPNSDGYTVIARAVRDAILLALGAPVDRHVQM